MERTDEIIISRLVKMGMDKIYWNNVPLTIKDVKRAIKSKIKAEDRIGDFALMENQSNEWHLSRIANFVYNPNLITPIMIENKVNGNSILPIPLIYDGNHRFMAARYLGMKRIKAYYNGRMDLLEYLTGESRTFKYEGVKMW